ncbi:aspartate aminotransferase family protein [Phenylobacterium sp.]|uniref:aspartate aminotransferase family protein n=1 Tax=Phenylobacterium sp. TaxID=1871053 RepID=UPI0027338372|nr:aspartate aminotransferase family protein [Phenylobacterium sp.]MDP3658950.1 aspartate aminotransferase family protein [Phenylobacterium sp.]
MTESAAPVPPDHLLGVYSRTPLNFERGEGVHLYTTDGEQYLDCLAGIAVNALGHANPKLVQVLKDQAEKLWHVSNIFTIPGQEALAKRLTDATFADVVFFTNSGTEAVECAIKTARKYHWAKGDVDRVDIIGFDGSFHGRSLAAVNASGNASYLEGFGPRMPGFLQLPFGDMDALRAAVGPTTAAIIIEPVQGEGGARSLSPEALRELRAICDEAGALLIYDEIQCGLSRTGKLFAYEWADGAEPDIMCIAKALGGGFPVGACLATAEAGSGMAFGSHGSTYGGNPLAMAVGLAAFEELTRPELLAHVRDVAGYFVQQLEGLKDRYPDVVLDIRGKGLLIGIKLATPNREFMQHARDQHLLVAGGGDNCVRLLPPLIITTEEASDAIARLERACQAAQAHAKAAA